MIGRVPADDPLRNDALASRAGDVRHGAAAERSDRDRLEIHPAGKDRLAVAQHRSVQGAGTRPRRARPRRRAPGHTVRVIPRNDLRTSVA